MRLKAGPLSNFLKLWNHRSVKGKIILALLPAIFFVLVVGSVGLWTSRRVAHHATYINDHVAPSLRAAEELKLLVFKIQQEALSYILLSATNSFSGPSAAMQEEIDEIGEAEEEFFAILKRHGVIDHIGHSESLHRATKAAFNSFMVGIAKLIDTAELSDLSTSERKLEGAEDELVASLDAMIAHDSEVLVTRQTELATTMTNLALLNLILILLSCFTSVIIAVQVARAIVRPIKVLEAASEQLRRGQFLSDDHPLTTFEGKNELGSLARTFKSMSSDLAGLNRDLIHSANHDDLTGLANRSYLLQRLEVALESARENGEVSTLLFLDFDRFKVVNDYYGHTVGDKLLVAFGERLSNGLRPNDLVARLGGDEFTILLEGVAEADAEQAAQRLLDRVQQPYDVDELTLQANASVGIVRIDGSFSNGLEVLRDADIAMYRAKANGAGRYEVFNDTLREEALMKMALEAELRQALENGEIEVHYQPIVSADGERFLATEALVRWTHPERGSIYPDQFIPIAEETGLILELDRYVLRRACAQTVAWNAQFGSSLGISVNLSGQQFASRTLVGDVAAALRETGLAPDALHLEITETVLMHQTDLTCQVLGELQALGVALHMDDFGTGYSSLAYLQYFSVDTLKIDRSFISGMLESPESAALVRTILAMAKTLKLKVIAEGVETEPQARYLQDLQCDFAQGYLFSKPLGSSAMESYLQIKLAPAPTAEKTCPASISAVSYALS